MLVGIIIYKPASTGGQKWWVWAIGIVIMLLVIIVIVFGSEDDATPNGQMLQPHTEGLPNASATATSVETTPDGFLKAGSYIVNDDIVPGRYRSDGGISYWKRLSGLTGEFGEIIANGALSSGSLYVDIATTDFACRFSGSGSFYLIDDSYRGKQKTSFEDGVYLVGVVIEPGRYRSDVGVDYWARLKGFSGDFNEFIANDAMSEGTAYVEIKPDDVGFETRGAQWEKVD